MSYAPFTDAQMVEMLARDNAQLSAENRRLKQVLDTMAGLVKLARRHDPSLAGLDEMPQWDLPLETVAYLGRITDRYPEPDGKMV